MKIHFIYKLRRSGDLTILPDLVFLIFGSTMGVTVGGVFSGIEMDVGVISSTKGSDGISGVADGASLVILPDSGVKSVWGVGSVDC